MNTRATKKQAVELIRTARRTGWAVKVSPMKLPSEPRPYCLQVSCVKSVDFSNGLRRAHAHIIVSFRRTRRGRWVNCITTFNDYSKKKKHRGLWHAQYDLNLVNTAAADQAKDEVKRNKIMERFAKTAPEFQTKITEIAATAKKTVAYVYGLWRKYSSDCEGADQSPVFGEFESWYRKELAD